MSRNLNNREARARRFLRPILAAGFLFFLVKGLLWLAVGAVSLTGLLAGGKALR